MTEEEQAPAAPRPARPRPGRRAPPEKGAGGLGTSLGSAVQAGWLAGSLLGLGDGIAAGLRTHIEGFAAWSGCLGRAILIYGLAWCALLALAALLLHPFLRGRAGNSRTQVLLALGLGAGLFVELYWWSRPYVYYGLSATDPKRIAASAGLLAAGLLVGWLLAWLGKHLPSLVKLLGWVAIAAGWVAGGIDFARGGTGDTERGALNERNAELPNVLLFVVDALRADVLGCYGHPRVKTPVIDALAQRGVLFENAIAQAPFTWPSFGSILTGKYPRRHGLVKMEPGYRMRPNLTLPLHFKSAKRLTGGELGERDTYSAAFLTGTLSHGSGLMQGFDAYYEALVGHELVVVDQPWSLFRSELVLSLLANKLRQKLDSHRVASVARQWFAEHKERRFVSLVHFYSTHTPYDPPEAFRRMYVDPKYAGPIHAFYADSRIAIERGQYAPTPEDREQIRNLYYAGVSQADAMIGEVLAELERQGALEHTLVIVTGDHGEELGDHGLWEHNWMYQTNLRVPLVMALPKKLPAGRRVAAVVESVDLVPTVCALAGLAPPLDAGEPDQRGILDGLDLGPLIRGETDRAKPFAFSENYFYVAIQDSPRESPPDAPLDGNVGEPRYKLIVRAGTQCEPAFTQAMADPDPLRRPKLFRLDTDPGELENVIAKEPAQALRLAAELCRFDARMPIPQSELVPSDRDLEERMRELGYTGSDAPRGTGSAPRPPGSPSSPGEGDPPHKPQ
jgi:arylsulfatase A-like enzyme